MFLKNDIKQSALFYLVGKRLTIRELADIFSVTPEKIRVWLEELDINISDVIESSKSERGYCFNCQVVMDNDSLGFCSLKCLDSAAKRARELDKIKRTKIVPTTAHRFLFYDVQNDKVLIKRKK